MEESMLVGRFLNLKNETVQKLMVSMTNYRISPLNSFRGNYLRKYGHGSCCMDIKVRIEKKTQEKEEKAKMPIGTSTKLFRQTLIDGH